MLSRLIASLVGAACVVYGVIAAISPLPLGVVSMIFGMLLIAAANPFARPLIRRLRRRFRWFDAIVRTLGRSGPDSIKPVVEQTAPETDPAAGSSEREQP